MSILCWMSQTDRLLRWAVAVLSFLDLGIKALFSIASSVVTSSYSSSLRGGADFAGILNHAKAFSYIDSGFLLSTMHTFLWPWFWRTIANPGSSPCLLLCHLYMQMPLLVSLPPGMVTSRVRICSLSSKSNTFSFVFSPFSPHGIGLGSYQCEIRYQSRWQRDLPSGLSLVSKGVGVKCLVWRILPAI